MKKLTPVEAAELEAERLLWKFALQELNNRISSQGGYYDDVGTRGPYFAYAIVEAECYNKTLKVVFSFTDTEEAKELVGKTFKMFRRAHLPEGRLIVEGSFFENFVEVLDYVPETNSKRRKRKSR